jgi:hypothetical protein
VTSPREALDAVLAACRAVPGLVAEAAGKAPMLPAVAVGAPELTWGPYSPEPAEAVFPVTLLVRLDGDAVTSLLRFVADLQAALELHAPATVSGAVPLSYDLGGGVEAAAYELTVTYPLS